MGAMAVIIGNGRGRSPGGGAAERLLGTAQDDEILGDPFSAENRAAFPDNGRTLDADRSGRDTILGLEGSDLLLGDAWIVQGTGRAAGDRILAAPRPDVVFGDAHRIRARGRGGDDRLLGGAGRDFLVGDFATTDGTGRCGNDLLDGGPGDDQLYSDAIDRGTGAFVGGRDPFRFGPNSGRDIVFDLELGKDIVDFRGFSGDPAGVCFRALGAAVLIDLDGVDASIQEVVLIGVSLDAVLRELDRTILF